MVIYTGAKRFSSTNLSIFTKFTKLFKLFSKKNKIPKSKSTVLPRAQSWKPTGSPTFLTATIHSLNVFYILAFCIFLSMVESQTRFRIESLVFCSYCLQFCQPKQSPAHPAPVAAPTAPRTTTGSVWGDPSRSLAAAGGAQTANDAGTFSLIYIHQSC